MAGAAAVIVELIEGGCPVRFTCADANAVPKGSVMYMATPRTAAISTADNQAFCGIAAEEKVALDGQVSIACFTKGLFDMVSGAATTAGELVSIGAAQAYKKVVADTDNLFADIGIALESAAGADEVDVVAVGIYSH